MKGIFVFINWSLTLVIGGAIASLIVQDVTGFVFSAIAAVFSMPYLLIMLPIARKLASFWSFQGVHLLLTCLTAGGLFLNKDALITIYWMPFLYFLLSFLLYFVMGTSYNPATKAVEESFAEKG